jgi:DNA replication ATP-dependent helicase Dna2
LKCIAADNYHMVLGTPGSGKTQAIVTLIRILAQMEKKVLVVSFTNQAIDNVLIRLKATNFNDFIRVTNNFDSVEDELHPHVRTAKKYTTIE